MAEKLLSDVQPGATILADKAYDTDAIRHFAKQRRCRANIPAKTNRKKTLHDYRSGKHYILEKDLLRADQTKSEVMPDNLLRLDFADHSTAFVRPSGTEPKAKIYIHALKRDQMPTSTIENHCLELASQIAVLAGESAVYRHTYGGERIS